MSDEQPAWDNERGRESTPEQREARLDEARRLGFPAD